VHGEQIRFGPDASLGLSYGTHGSIQTVLASSVPESELIVHDATLADPSYAFALSRLDSYDFTHTPVGVFRAVERGSYDDAMAAQINTARARGAGDLGKLLAGNDTWEVS
jgi:2-oxoglutarate ferredoxin oxidoreductase subunit beta